MCVCEQTVQIIINILLLLTSNGSPFWQTNTCSPMGPLNTLRKIYYTTIAALQYLYNMP